MAGMSAYAEKAMLDWLFGGATSTQPAAHFAALMAAVPTSTAYAEISPAGYARQTITYSAASSPAGTTKNLSAIIFTFSAGCSVTGIGIFDTAVIGAGKMLFWGNLSAVSTMASGDSLSIAINSHIITLA